MHSNLSFQLHDKHRERSAFNLHVLTFGIGLHCSPHRPHTIHRSLFDSIFVEYISHTGFQKN